MALTAKAGSMERQALKLAAEPLAVSEARAWLSEVAEDLLESDRRQELALVVSEVVTNAVRHGEGGETARARGDAQARLPLHPGDRRRAGARSAAGCAARPRRTAATACSSSSSSPAAGASRARENHTRVWFEFDYQRPAACSPQRFVPDRA